MKRTFYILLSFLLTAPATAQKNSSVYPFASCNNFDFESGYTGWGGQAWNFVTSTTFVITPTVPYHKLTGAGFDNIIAPLSTLAPSGGTQSALIGLPNPGSQEYWIDQTFVVSATDPVYVYQDAVVFKDLDQFSPPHSTAQQNYFEVLFTDQNGDTIPCGYSKVLVSQATPANGYQAYIYTDPNQSPPNNLIPHLWKDWTSTAVDLTAYIGTNVTVRFRAHSCSLGDHYTYAYIDGHCEPATSNNTLVSVCQGATATLNGPPGFTGYAWLPGGQTTQDIQTGTGGSYTVTATGQAACVLVQTYSVTINPAPAIFANPTNVNICEGNSTTLSASATPSTGTTFSWAPSTALSSTTGTPVTASPTTSVTYTVIGTDANGCTNFSSVAVNMGQNPVAVVADQTICAGQPATITASGGGAYSWNTGQTTADISVNPTAATSYTVVVTNPAGCSDTAVANLSIAPLLTVSVTSATICSGQTATVTASGGINYSWNTGVSSSSITVNPSSSNSYTVVVSNASGCSGIAVSTVSVSPSPVVSVANTTVCSGQTATLSASGGNNYSWNTGQTSSAITVAPTVVSTYSVIASDANGCTGVASATVSVLQLPTAVISANATICLGQTTTLTASGGGNYSWNTGATSGVISVSPTATISYSVTVSNSCGTSSSSASVTVNPLPAVNAGSDLTICPGGSSVLSASGTGNYLWNTGASSSSIIVTPTATTTYSVTSSNSCGSISDQVTVTIGNSLVASISGSTNICVGTSTVLSASGGTVFIWTNGSTSNAISVSPSVTTSYSVIVSSGTCTDTAVFTVNVSPPPVAVSGNATICQGQTAVLNASGGGTYLWNTGSTASSISVSAAGNYSVVVSAGGCSDSASALVTVNPNPTANAGNSIVITQGQSAMLSATGGGTYLWSNGESDSLIPFSPCPTTLYCVTVSNGSCTDTSCVLVYVEPVDCGYADDQLFVPDAFSPNGDAKNDKLGIYFPNTTCIKEFELIIYDRWGEKVFEASNITTLWDGTYKGVIMNTAVFVYYLKITFISGNETQRKGNISLIK